MLPAQVFAFGALHVFALAFLLSYTARARRREHLRKASAIEPDNVA